MMGCSPAIPLRLTLRYAQRRTFIAKYAKKGREGREENPFPTRTNCAAYPSVSLHADSATNGSKERRRLAL